MVVTGQGNLSRVLASALLEVVFYFRGVWQLCGHESGGAIPQNVGKWGAQRIAVTDALPPAQTCLFDMPSRVGGHG